MKLFNKENLSDKTSKDTKKDEQLSDMIKTIAIYEAKSAVVKVKLLKHVTEIGIKQVSKTIDRANEFIDMRIKEKENKD